MTEAEKKLTWKHRTNFYYPEVWMRHLSDKILSGKMTTKTCNSSVPFASETDQSLPETKISSVYPKRLSQSSWKSYVQTLSKSRDTSNNCESHRSLFKRAAVPIVRVFVTATAWQPRSYRRRRFSAPAATNTLNYMCRSTTFPSWAPSSATSLS